MTVTIDLDQEVARLTPWVWAIIRKDFGNVASAFSPDDLFQVAMEAVCRSVSRYRPDRGASFSTFALFRARGAMLDYVRDQLPGTRANREQWPASLDEPIFNDAGDHVTIADMFPDWDPEPTDTAFEARLFAEVDRLPETTGRIFRLYVEGEYTMREIGQLEGVTESRVCQRVNQARRLLKPRVAPLVGRAA